MPDLSIIRTQFATDVATVTDSASLDVVRQTYFGRKHGLVTVALKSLKDLPLEERRTMGPAANALRQELEDQLQVLENQFAATASQTDLTLPGIRSPHGHLHPLTQTQNEMIEIFSSMGFMVYDGPELDNDWYNFESLNIPPSHPARDIQDTFFIKTPITRSETRTFEHQQWVMRTQTSNMQVRLMEQFQPPLRCIVPGRVYRNEATDPTHEHTFYQLEGFVVDENITIGHLIWTLQELFRQFYKKPVTIRLRPGYFPFVEPGFEPDMSCVFCDQAGCRICKYTGWIEMGGSGMIHPNVFKAAGYPPGKYTGFAFGMGLSRLTMLKHNIPDIRLMMENDIRFLEQF